MSDSPKIYTLANGRKVVAAEQKSGDFHVIDAATGDIVHSATLITQASTEGGFQSGGAYADNTVLQHGLTTSTVSGAPYDGIVMGISRDGERVKWQLRVPASPLLAGISAANGVAYFSVSVRRADRGSAGSGDLGAVRRQRPDRRRLEASAVLEWSRRERTRGVAGPPLRGLRPVLFTRHHHCRRGRRLDLSRPLC